MDCGGRGGGWRRDDKNIMTKATKAVRPVIVVPIATPDATLNELRQAGYVPVQWNDPEKVVVKTLEASFDGHDLLMSAMYGLSVDHASHERSRMVQELHRRLLVKESKRAK